jgi:hypothetical protein
MHTLLGHAIEYARARGVELVIIDSGGPPLNSYMTARAGPVIILGLSSATASSPNCGEWVYAACEELAAAKALVVNVHQPAEHLLAF